MAGPVLEQVQLGSQWVTVDPFLFCVHHRDAYPRGDGRHAPAASLSGRSLGHHCELPLCQAVFVREFESAAWLLERGAALDDVDGKRGVSGRDMLRSIDDPRARALLS